MRTRIENAVARLLHARTTGEPLAALPADAQPQSLAEAYAIQDGLIAAWPDTIAGWKVGATSLEIQTLFGVTEPVYGPVFAATVFQSPATVSAAAFPHRLLETEFTFRFGQAVPARAASYARAEILDFVDAVLPSLEIINPRFSTLTVDNIPQLVADFGANGGAVLGMPLSDWRSLDLSAVSVSSVIDGHVRQTGTGHLVLGNPLNVLEWFVNTRTTAGHGVSAGQFVMTGTMTGVHAPQTGQSAVGRFAGIGDVAVSFA